MVAHTLVNTLVVTAENDEVTLHRHFVGYLLVESFTIWRNVNLVFILALCLQCSNAAVYWFTLHHHAGTSAVWIVVHTLPFI